MLLVDSNDRSSASDIHKELESIRDSYSEFFQPKDELDLPLGLTTEQDAESDRLQQEQDLSGANDGMDQNEPEPSSTQDEGLHTTAVPSGHTAAMVVS